MSPIICNVIEVLYFPMMAVNASDTVNNVARLDSLQKQNVMSKKDTGPIVVKSVHFFSWATDLVKDF